MSEDLIVDGWLMRLRHPYSYVRREACEVLRQLRNPRSLEPLIERLGDREGVVRQAACTALGRLGQGSLAKALGAVIEGSSDGVARLEEIAASRNGHVTVGLVALLNADSPTARQRVCRAIGELGDAQAVEPLIKCLGDADRDVQRAGGKALRQLGEGDLADALFVVLRGETGGVSQLGQLVAAGSEYVTIGLVALLNSNSFTARQRVCRTLGELGDAQAVGPLIECLGDSDTGVRCAACEALGQLGDDHAVEPLARSLRDKDSNVGRAAIRALVQLGDFHAVQPLTECLALTDIGVRRAACKTLGQLGDARAVGPLVKCLGGGDSDVQRSAYQALRQLGQGSLAEALLAVTTGSSGGITRLQELVTGGNDHVTIGLMALLRGGLGRAHHRACQALGQVGDARAVEQLIETLGDKDRSMRDAALVSLRAIYHRARRNVAGYLCTEHLARFEHRKLRKRMGLFSYQTIRYLGCRVCGGAEQLWQGVNEVACVLDSKAPEDPDPQFDTASGQVRALWTPDRELFDFDVIEIRHVTDNDVEQFCIRVGNDEDPRYKGCCAQVKRVAGYCRLSDYIWAMLRDRFPNADVQRKDPVRQDSEQVDVVPC